MDGGAQRHPHQPGACRRGPQAGARDGVRLLPLLHDDVRGRSQGRSGIRGQGAGHCRGARGDLRSEADLSPAAWGGGGPQGVETFCKGGEEVL